MLLGIDIDAWLRLPGIDINAWLWLPGIDIDSWQQALITWAVTFINIGVTNLGSSLTVCIRAPEVGQ